MTFKTKKLFPTVIGSGSIRNAKRFNQKLLKEILHYSHVDKLGQSWSKTNYKGGYTSYASLSDMHRRTPLFSEFDTLMLPKAVAFAKAQGWNLKGLELEMTNCWMNIMPANTYHTLHLHPHSVISGTYYVSSPKGSVSLKLEDPRMPLYMNAPPREVGKQSEQSLYYEVVPTPGSFVLFESWLRHEVPPNQSKEPRISVSFNYRVCDETDG